MSDTTTNNSNSSTQPSDDIDKSLLDALKARLSFRTLLLIGAPCSGKGTQAAILSSLLGVEAVSTGDLFRAEVKTGSELGKKMKTFMDAGQLIPNELTTDFLTQKFAEDKYQHGLIVDGYPREQSHLEIFESIMNNLDMSMLGAIYLDVPEEKLRERVTARVVCGTCGAISNRSAVASSSTQCTTNGCKGTFGSRADDDLAVFTRRYDIFKKQTMTLVPIMEERKLLVRIPPLDSPKLVAKHIISELVQMITKKSDTISAYKWLDERVPLLGPETSEGILKEYRDRALVENLSHRSGIVRRFVYLQTTNVKKYLEHISIFEGLYGIEVLRLPVNLSPDVVKVLLKLRSKELIPLAVIREESNLYRPNSTAYSTLRQGVKAVNRATLVATSLSVANGEIVVRKYQHDTPGHVDLTKRKARLLHTGIVAEGHAVESDPSVFGWDDIFVVNDNGFTYHQLREFGIKHSARDMVISEFLKDVVHYKDMLSLAFTEIKTSRPVDFSVSLADLSDNNEYYNNPLAIKYGYRKMVNNAVRMGTFLRRAKNRRQNTYWSPGTNGGIPMVKKADKIHEDTFRAHDIGHYMIPDLIFTGVNSVNHRRAYIAYRMISEATTMTLADMLFVDALKQSGVTYDFEKRRIYPLFRDLKIDLAVHDSVEHPDFIAKLRKIVHANYIYCLKGDDSMYRKLLGEAGSSDASLVRFKEKFMPFFVEDFRWTEHNYDNMLKRSEELSRWWNDIKPLRSLPDIFVESVDEFLNVLIQKDPEILYRDEQKFIDLVFDEVFERNVRPILINSTPLPSKNVLMFRAFTRWLIGQLSITSKFHFLPESRRVREKIISEVLPHYGKDTFTLDHVAAIRTEYEAYLKFLAERNFISKDDERTFAEVYPLFDPYYISYDKNLAEYEDLGAVSRRIFSMETHIKKQLQLSEAAMSRSLSDSEKNYIGINYRLIEAGGGQIHNGLFVTRPGVQLLCHTENSVPMQESNHVVTFLISGIAIETSLELIAHKEASVARLTSSKTNAMNTPLYRVQGHDTSSQQFILSEILRSRAQFEITWKPQQAWNLDPSHKTLGTELFNMTQPATKCTCLCYSMTLSDYHNLFIGRMGPNGNEYDVRHVVSRMAEILHQKYPKYIQPPSVYLTYSNKEKLNTKALEVTVTSPPSEIQIIGNTVLSTEIKNLFQSLHINTSAPDYVQLSEFRSRITYLAFPQETGTPEKSSEYVRKIVNEHGHASILAACQVIFALPSSHALNPDSVLFKFTKKFAQSYFLFVSLKELRAVLLTAPKEDPHYDMVQKIHALAKSSWPVLFS